MVVRIDHAQFQPEIVQVEEALRHQVVAGIRYVIVDGVVRGRQHGVDGCAGDAVAPGHADVGGAAVGAPEGGVGEDAGVEGGG